MVDAEREGSEEVSRVVEERGGEGMTLIFGEWMTMKREVDADCGEEDPG